MIDGINKLLMEKLAQRNIYEASAIQALTIPHILAGEDLIFQSPTGTGKTFAYLLPLFERLKNGEEQILIIAPTLELCSQIKSEAEFLGQKTALLIGSANLVRQIETLKREKPRVIVGNVARLLLLQSKHALRLSGITVLVMDEADRLVSDEQLAQTSELIGKLPKKHQTLACSATMGNKARERIGAFTNNPRFLMTEEQEILREHIRHWVLFSEERRKLKTLTSFLAATHAKKTLVFTSKTGQVGNIVAHLQHHKITVDGLFSDIAKGARKQALDNFRKGKIAVLVSSDLAARGLDIPNVTHVVCLDMPDIPDAYVHRVGRTARAGKKGTAVLIGDEQELRRFSVLEKKLGITVYPKVLWGGRIEDPPPPEAHAQ